MNRPPEVRKASERGSALVITLLMIVLLTILVLTVTVQTQLERQLSATHIAEQQARSFAQMGLDSALAHIRETLSPFDDPFGSTNRPDHFWSLSPGRIDLFDFTPNAAGRPKLRQTVVLHSGYPLTDPNDAANLNAPDSYGHRPIWSENRRMEVDWVAVGRDPAEPLSANNPMAGRFAFWVDDEGSKINVNTADGSDNYTLSSYGQGTPTAVSLSVFRDLGDANAPDRETVRAIAAAARRQPFATIAEMATRKLSLTHPITGEVTEKAVSPKFPATNAFNLTTYSRSPDFNLFNLPKFQLIPSNVDSLAQLAGANNFIAVNRMIQYPAYSAFSFYGTATSAAQSALRSIYPTPSQLTGAWTNNYTNQPVWPLMPTYPRPVGSSGYLLIASAARQTAAGGNFTPDSAGRLGAMIQMESYLLGTNALGQAVRWPFRDGNYLEKYNLRQLDSITLQIFEMARGASLGANPRGEEVMLAGIAPYGIIGTNAVMSAAGRHPRLARILGVVHLQPRPPVKHQIGMNSGGSPIYEKDEFGNEVLVYDGANFRMGLVYSLYLPRHLYDADNYVDNTLVDQAQQVSAGWGNAAINEADWLYGPGSMLNPGSPAQPRQWMDNQIYAESRDSGQPAYAPGNSSGIDFRGNNPFVKDPDYRAPIFRRPSVKKIVEDLVVDGVTNKATNAYFQVWGSGYDDWASGATRPLFYYNVYGPNANMPFLGAGLLQNFSQYYTGGPATGARSTNAVQDAQVYYYGLRPYATRNLGDEIESIRLRGGVTARFRGNDGTVGVYPIENIVGPLGGGSSDPLAVAARTSLKNAADVEQWRKDINNRIIPLFERFEEGGTKKNGGLELALNQSKFLVAKARDPLVSQLSGDWVIKVYSSRPGADITGNPQIFNYWPLHEYAYSVLDYPRDPAFDFLPEPEWVDMAADSGSVNPISGSAATGAELQLPYWEDGKQKIRRINAGGIDVYRLLNLSRQKSFPSVGRLQYLRTGAMPDNENAKVGDDDYAGMPFRCLNFGPANTQGGIPDWALLDLFTVPNAIWTQPSSRFAYPVISDAQTNRPELVHLTYGGASTGKINLNGAVLWPWAENDSGFVRPMPLAAQFDGLRLNQTGKVKRTWAPAPAVNWNVSRLAAETDANASWNVLAAPEAASLAEAIAAYIRTNGPFSLPGQICDVPAVNAYGARIPTELNGESLLPPNTGFYGRGIPSPDGLNRTRNDLVSQSIGNLVTQGNVFAVWVTGQSIRKSPTSDPTAFEPGKGDRVGAQTRLRFLVERKLDPGIDGVYGNAKPKVGSTDPGPAGWDGIIGSPDDLLDNDYHPRNPKFIYRVVAVQEIQ